MRKEAINTLAILGDFGELTEDDVKQIAADPDLARTYYRAKHDVHWRQGGMARFEY